MSKQGPLAGETQIVQMSLEEALEKATSRSDPNAGLIMALMYQELINTIDDILDEHEHDDTEAVAEIAQLIALARPQPMTLN